MHVWLRLNQKQNLLVFFSGYNVYSMQILLMFVRLHLICLLYMSESTIMLYLRTTFCKNPAIFQKFGIANVDQGTECITFTLPCVTYPRNVSFWNNKKLLFLNINKTNSCFEFSTPWSLSRHIDISYFWILFLILFLTSVNIMSYYTVGIFLIIVYCNRLFLACADLK